MQIPDANDGELAAAVSDDRSEDAFRELLRRHGPLIHGVCRRLLPNSQDVDDAVQSTLLTLSLKSGELRGRPSITGWLHHVARHSALHVRRDRARDRRRTLAVDEVAQLPSRGTDAQADLKEIIDLELDALPEIYRVPIILCYLDGHPPGEAARMCGRKPSAFSMQLARGLERLRERLRRHGFSEAPALALPLLIQPLQAPLSAPLVSTLAQVPVQHAAIVKSSLASLHAAKIAFVMKGAAVVLAVVLGAAMSAVVARHALAAPDAPATAVDRSTPRRASAPAVAPAPAADANQDLALLAKYNELLEIVICLTGGVAQRQPADLEALCSREPFLAKDFLTIRDSEPYHLRTALHFLVRGNDYGTVRLDDAPPHVPAFGSPTTGAPAPIDPIIAAIDILLAHGAAIDAADPANPWTPLIEARDARLAEHLLARGASDSIFYRARAGDAAAVRGMLERQPAQARATGPEGATPLHFAAMGCSGEVCRALIAAGADVNAVDHEGRTPLVWLFRGYYGRLMRPERRPEQVALAFELVAAGARWDLDSAIFAGATDAVATLIGAHPDPVEFAAAVALDRPEIVSLMIDRGVDINGSQALVDAVRTRNAAMVRLLIEHGADPDLKTNYGTPRALIATFPSPEVSAEFAAHPPR